MSVFRGFFADIGALFAALGASLKLPLANPYPRLDQGALETPPGACSPKCLTK